LLFVTWGYIDKPNISGILRIATHALAFVVPALFLVGVAGVMVLCGSEVGILGWVGMVLALYGSGLGAVSNVIDVEPLLYAYFEERGWPPALIEWLAVVDAGLILVGIATIGTRRLRRLDALTFAIGAFGWVYDLTDSVGVAFETAPGTRRLRSAVQPGVGGAGANAFVSQHETSRKTAHVRPSLRIHSLLPLPNKLLLTMLSRVILHLRPVARRQRGANPNAVVMASMLRKATHSLRNRLDEE
jgi:hypothetical protein